MVCVCVCVCVYVRVRFCFCDENSNLAHLNKATHRCTVYDCILQIVLIDLSEHLLRSVPLGLEEDKTKEISHEQLQNGHFSIELSMAHVKSCFIRENVSFVIKDHEFGIVSTRAAHIRCLFS